MKKQVSAAQNRIEVNQEKLLQKDWCSLGVRAAYWTGSPWRAVGMMFR